MEGALTTIEEYRSFRTCQGKIDEYNSIWICKWRDWLKGYQLIWESMKSMEGELWYPPRDFDDADMNMLLNWEKGYQINWVLIKLMKGKLWYLLRNFINADEDYELLDFSFRLTSLFYKTLNYSGWRK